MHHCLSGGLLPHLFTLTSNNIEGGFPFCGTFCCPTVVEHLPVKKYAALCCPDFPPPAKTEGDEVVCATKVVQLSRFFSLLNLQTLNIVYFRGKLETMQAIKASELVLSEGRVYHLDLSPEQISDTIILVGDQFRVAKVSTFFDSVEYQVQKREFVCHTGYYRGKRLSVVSTGIGTDNVDIVLNELDALFNFDLEKRCEKQTKTSLNLIRIGTCGALHADTPPGTFILSQGSFGLDNVAHFYEIENTPDEQAMITAFTEHVGFPSTLVPYFTYADASINEQLAKHENVKQGLTVTASGFYGPQGRKLRLPLKINGLNDAFSTFRFQGKHIANFEMESSAIFALSRGLGHRAATICVALANRASGDFLADYDAPMETLIRHVLNSITA